ncbi:Transposase [Rickettsiales bacterium Ac37b]|nr:Transposase [Rickettsiales bacterium Ac37b]AIL64433.1 Transposase [Rickettsiales bacterium Ac37b]AIL64440.1 Transposase [Rickettsiales bacterium Ac37b]AIL64447.1 Transposase [Rickettsiales bacterium Ac37b]AIL64460.1 Transposase [Rickettsiales bacterium Ac37b]
MAYSLDLRKKVIHYVNKGYTREEAARIFGIGERTIYRWLSRSKSGNLAATRAAKPWKKLDPIKLLNEVSKNSNWLLSDFAKVFNVSTAAICLAFKTLGITRKKRPHSIVNGMKQNGNYFWQLSQTIKRKI